MPKTRVRQKEVKAIFTFAYEHMRIEYKQQVTYEI